jgi:hypothetical protein
MTNSSPWKDPPIFKFGKPSISIRAIYTMAMLVITREYHHGLGNLHMDKIHGDDDRWWRFQGGTWGSYLKRIFNRIFFKQKAHEDGVPIDFFEFGRNISAFIQKKYAATYGFKRKNMRIYPKKRVDLRWLCKNNGVFKQQAWCWTIQNTGINRMIKQVLVNWIFNSWDISKHMFVFFKTWNIKC